MDRSIIQRSVAPSSKGPPASTSGPPVALRKRRPNLPGRLLDQRVISHLGIQRPPRGLRTARQGVRAAGSERLDACDRRTVVVWEEATAVRHRVLVRPSADGRTFSPERILAPRPRRRRHAARGVHRGVAGTRILKREDSRADAARRDALTRLSVTFSFAIDGTEP